jgi:hypothetical protein
MITVSIPCPNTKQQLLSTLVPLIMPLMLLQVEKAGMTVGMRAVPDKGYDMDELEVRLKTVTCLVYVAGWCRQHGRVAVPSSELPSSVPCCTAAS